MANFNIDKVDLEQIEAILRNNINIERLYKKLCTLDLAGKKKTEEYTKLLDYLSIVIEVETKLYKEAKITQEKALSWINFLKEAKTTNNEILARIKNILLEIITKNYSVLINLSKKELEDILKLSGIKLTTKNIEKDTICKCIIIKETIEKDIFYTFLSFIQEQIEDPKQKIFKENLTKAKYDAIFMNKDIETFALENNLNLPINPYINSILIKDLLNIDSTLYKNIKDIIGYKLLLNEIYELLEITDSEYSDIDKSSEAVIRQCMINSTLPFMSEEKIMDANYDFHEYIEDKEYQDIHPSNKVSENLIINCFKEIKRNKSKLQILSLK